MLNRQLTSKILYKKYRQKFVNRVPNHWGTVTAAPSLCTYSSCSVSFSGHKFVFALLSRSLPSVLVPVQLCLFASDK